MADMGKLRVAWRLGRLPYPEIIAVLGGVIFLVQALIFAHHRLPNLDEGAYLYKGLLLARGDYVPFQPYGLWINKMYLSFYIWGWVQLLFSPGLLAPRTLAVALSLLSVWGVWILARRLGNRWLAALAVLVLALNPTLISIYSTARSQVLVLCMLIWVLVLTLGEKRPLWQVLIGSVLAGVMILTRENMVFVLPFLIGYNFWQHGRKTGLFALIALLIILIAGHLLFWPEILMLWRKWLPFHKLLPAIPGTSLDIGKAGITEAVVATILARLQSFSQGFRNHLIPVASALVSLLLWPRKKAWRSPAQFREAVFLALVFFTLFISHGWASLSNDYCVFCFTDYLAFFAPLGLLLLVVTLSSLNRSPAPLTRVLCFLSIPVVCITLGFSLFEQIGNSLVHFPIPRLRDGQFLPGWATLGEALVNKWGIPTDQSRMFLPVLAGLGAGLILLLAFTLLHRRIRGVGGFKPAAFIVLGSLALGAALLPAFTWPYAEPLCRSDVISFYESIGTQLTEVAPPGTRIYLDGSRTAVPLLYTQGLEILLPQLNDKYSFRTGGDPDQVLRSGYWNEQVAHAWLIKSDLLLIEYQRLSRWQERLASNEYEEIPLSSEPCSCTDEARLYLFRRK
jgi:hypothetical protein